MGEALAIRWCAHGARTARRRSIWAWAGHWLAGGARTGRARQDGGAPGHGRGIGFPGAGPALRPKAGQSLRHLLRAKPFCRARLVRAPMAGKCLRAWQVLRKGARLRPCHVRSTGYPVVRARGAHGKTAPRLAMCGALAILWCAHRARTAKRRSAWPCAEPLAAKGLAISQPFSFQPRGHEIAHFMAPFVEFAVGQLPGLVRIKRKEQHAAL